MFGYLTVCRDELKIKDERTYKAYYCGICEELRKQHGQISRFSLTYDMTFLALLLQGVYEGQTQSGKKRCLPHPVKPHPVITGKSTAYAADMNVLLCYYDHLDDWEDEKKTSGLVMSHGMRRTFEKTAARYPRQMQAIQTYLKELKNCEATNSQDVDLAAGLTGKLMAEIFSPEEDSFREILGRLGFQLGKFIYLMDAWEDIEKDLEKGNYNPFFIWAKEPEFDNRVHQLLLMIASDAARAFEQLPIEENVDILRNILYCGIWSKYQMTMKHKKEKKK